MVEGRRDPADDAGACASDVLDAHPDATLVVVGGVVVRANRASLRMFQAPHDRVVGRRLAELLVDGDGARLGHFEAQRAEGWALPEACQMRFVCDGRVATADVRFDYIDLGGARALVLSARDVTDQSRAERLIAELGHLMSDAAAMAGADALLDAGAPVFRELGWSIAFTELFDGYSITRRVLAAPGDPVGEYGQSLVDRRLSFDATPVLAEVVRTGRAIFLDNVPALLDGVAKHAAALSEALSRAKISRTAWAPVRVRGQLSYLLTVAGGSMTEHDFAAIQLLAAQVGAAIRLAELRTELVARERLAAVGETAAVLAHEMRNPLAVIGNTLALLRRGERSASDTELLGYLGAEFERIHHLVRNVLVFVGPPSVATSTDVSLADLVDEATSATRQDPVFAAASARLEVDVPASLPRVRAEASTLRRALVNLLVNALEHVPRGGLVRVTARPEGELVVLRVMNEGAPIPDEIASRVFAPFFTTKRTGTGLGLAVVKRIVDDLGGRVELERGAEGITFAVRLRAA